MYDSILVDSNVILDVVTSDPAWFDWSSETLARSMEDFVLVVNPVIYAEVSVRLETIEAMEKALPPDLFARYPIPYEAAFLAGKCYMRYKQRGGKGSSVLPDFLIGAHAAVSGFGLLTRDVSRYRTYFPTLPLICPDVSWESFFKALERADEETGGFLNPEERVQTNQLRDPFEGWGE